MKKMCCRVFILAIASALLCSCASPSPAKEKEPIRIRIWSYYNGTQLDSFNELVKQFNSTVGAEKGIIAENSSVGDINELTDNVRDSVTGKIGSDKLPNIFSAYADSAYEMDQFGILADLSPYLTEEDRALYVESYLEEGNFSNDGSLKIFPIAKSTEVFFLNKTDWAPFAQATGVTYEDISTIEGLTATAQLYYEWTDAQTPEANDGKAFFGRDSLANYIFVGSMQLGEEIFPMTPDGIVLNFDRATMKKLWDNFYIPFIKGYFVASGRFRSDDVKVGALLSYVGSSSSATFFPSAVLPDDNPGGYAIELEALPAPCFKNRKPYAVQQGAGMVVTSASEEEVAASVEFLKWFTQETQNVKFSVDSGYMPVTKSTNDIEVIRRYQESIPTSVEHVLNASIQTVNESTLYTALPFEGCDAARKILEYSMSDLAQADRATVVARLQQGLSLEEASAEFTSEKYFDRWYQKTETALAATLG